MSSKHVIVGGLGNLGRHLQRTLLEHGQAVSVLDRPTSESSQVVHSSVATHPFTLGSDGSYNTLVRHLRGAETVYSVVTPDVQHGTIGDFQRTNRHGIQQLVNACGEAGVENLVYASSIAVTNHFEESVGDDETASLPELDSCKNHYDLTKPHGEDIVLKGNNDDSGLRTCALRLGGVMAGPKDYGFRDLFRMGESSGTVYTALGKPIDMIAASDAATAMYKAHQTLSGKPTSLAGRALFVTKCLSMVQSDVVPSIDQVVEAQAELMGWEVSVTPPIVLDVMKTGMRLMHVIQEQMTSDKESLPGMPFHLFVDIINYQQTFDNTLAHKILDFTPEKTWEQAMESIVEEYRNFK